MPLADQLGHPAVVLLVDDSPSDALLTKEALRFGEAETSVHHVTDGVEALAFMRRGEGYLDAPRPNIVLLDLNMPRMSGFEVLAAMQADDDLRRLPVIMLTTSADEHDICKAYDLQANCFITKPAEMPEFIAAVKAFEKFWLSWAALPQ